MQTLQAVLSSLAVNVFLGTLPLLGAIVQQNARTLRAIIRRLDSMTLEGAP
jgi:hypothetical protein